MGVNASQYSDSHSFEIKGASYIGNPKPNTVMFVSRKVGELIQALDEAQECLVFAETGLSVSDELLQKHCFVFSNHPQRDYARVTEKLFVEEDEANKHIKYNLSESGALISDTATIGKNVVIESGVVIGPRVIIGDNTRVLSGAIIKNATIGDRVIINEKAVVGANGFTMAEDEGGNKIRIYSLGRIQIGDDVEIGVHDNISRGSGGDTIIEDSVKLDAMVHIGHDVHLHKNVEITAGVVVGGFVEAHEGAYMGIHSVIRNRVELGAHCFVGMGATVTKSVEEGVTVVGNPAKPFTKR